MATEPRSINKLWLGIAVGITLFSLWAYIETYPRNPSPYPGLALLLYIDIPIVAIGGVILGIELSKVSPASVIGSRWPSSNLSRWSSSRLPPSFTADSPDRDISPSTYSSC